MQEEAFGLTPTPKHYPSGERNKIIQGRPYSTKSQVFPLKRCSFMYLMTR
jgi:hypothetical protein